MIHLESRSCRNDGNCPEKKDDSKTEYFVEFKSPSPDSIAVLVKELGKICASLKLLPVPNAPATSSVWFPRCISELHRCCTALFKYGSDLGTDHPGYGDAEYAQRRRVIAEISKDYK